MNRRFFVWNSVAGVVGFKQGLSWVRQYVLGVRGQSSPEVGAKLAALPVGNTNEPIRAITLEFGVQDIFPTRWDGNASISEGTIVKIRGHHFDQDDQMIDGLHWHTTTSAWPPTVGNGDLNPREEARPHATAVKTTGVTIYYQAPETARLRVRITGAEYGSPLNKIAGSSETPYLVAPIKEFEFQIADVPEFAPLHLLVARVLAYRTPPVEQISAQGKDVDYPSLTLDREGNLWGGWVEYRDSADEIWLRRCSQGLWGEPIKATESPGDVSSLAIAADGESRIWVVWSQRLEDDWHLISRCYDHGSWRPIKQITGGGGNNLFPCLAADRDGNLYLVWQSFRSGCSNIYLKELHGDVWIDEVKLSDPKKPRRANEWSPAVVVDHAGTAWVAWDSYHTGSYNIMLRSVKNGVPGELLRVTDSPRFHAHASLAVDDQDRLWIAYDEAEENWGKDVGYHFSGGAGLYQSRTIRFAIRAVDQWLEPRSDLLDAMPPGSQGFIQLPCLVADGRGGMWVLFRSRTETEMAMTRFAAGGRWDFLASHYSGDHWSAPIVIPESSVKHNQESPVEGLTDKDGRCWATWAADGIFVAGHEPAKVETMELGPRSTEPPARKPAEPREQDNVAAIRNYAIKTGGKTYRIFRGDMHRHTEISPDGAGEGSLFDAYRYAIDVANFDFVAVTDHMHNLSEYSWWRGEKAADMFHVPGFFTALFGYERSVGYPNGHRNVVSPKRGVRVLPLDAHENMGQGQTLSWNMVDTQMEMAAGQPPGDQVRGVVRSSEVLYPYLRKHGAIAMAHTPVNSVMGTDWGGEIGFTTDPQVEPLVEIFQGARISSEHEGAPLTPSKTNPELQNGEAGGHQHQGWVWNAWQKGYKLGVQASSDHISTHCSYSCVIAEEGTREGLLDAMRRRHCYGATTNIILDFRLRNESTEYLMGDEAPTRFVPTLVVKVVGANTIAQVHVIRDNQYVHSEKGSGPGIEFTYREEALPPGEHYYYVRAEQADGHVAWASPIWVNYQKPGTSPSKATA